MARKKNIAAGQNAVIYARYSSHNQREVSIEQQVRECMKHAAELGLHVVGTYEDRAISGKTDKRPNFQRMMRDAEKGKFQAVVAWKSNRIGRNMLQAMVNEAKLEDCGVKVFYAEEDFDDTAAGRFALRNMMNVNQFYSENMAEDITRGLYDNASKCMANGRQPLGYKRGEDGRVVLDEANAAVVREIFTRVAAGDLFVDIARDLNAQGIKTSKGANWNKGSFQSICQNERYRGIYIYGDVRVADGIPRIVSDDLWYRVQEAMRMKKNPVGTRHRVGAEDYLLTGKLRCGHCGSYMTGVSGTSRNGELHYYYTCQKRRTEHACDKKNIRRDVIEPAVAQAIKMYCLTDDVIAWIADRTVEYWEKHDNDLQIEALEQQLEENKKATSNMLKAIEMGIITEATRTRMVELETEQSRLSVQLNVAKEDVVKIDREQIISYLELLQQGDIHDRDFQMELFKNFLVAVYVYDDNRMKLVFSCMGDQNSVEIPLETGEDPPDGGLSPDAKMFVLTPDSSTKKALYFVGSMVLFFFFSRKKWGLHCLVCIVFRCFAGGSVQPPSHWCFGRSEDAGSADDLQHLIEHLFHLPHQRELGASAVKVVVGSGGVEIVVALQIVGQKADAALQRHQLGTPGKALFLRRAHGSPGGGEIPLGEHLVQVQVKVDLALVGLVLGAVVGTGADGVAEIVGRQTRHHSVKVNDTDAFSGGGIDQDVVDLGVVVGDTQRDLTGRQQIQQGVAIFFPRMDEGDLRCNVLGTAQRIGGKGFFKVCIAVGRVVEAGNGFVEGGGRIICQLVLEFAQGLGNSAEVGLAAHLLQADGILHKVVGAPRTALGIQMAGCAGQGGDHVQGLPCRVAACGKDLLPQMPGHAADILHQAHRVGKGVGVDAL